MKKHLNSFVVALGLALFSTGCALDADEELYDDEAYVSPAYRCFVYKKGDPNYTWDYDTNSDESHDWTKGKDGGTYKTTCAKNESAVPNGEAAELDPVEATASRF